MTRSGEHLDEEIALDLVHGLLDRDRKERAAAHVLECSDCAELVRVSSRTFEERLAGPRPKIDDDGEIRLGSRSEVPDGVIPIDSRRPRSPGRSVLVGAVAAAAAVLVVALLRAPDGMPPDRSFWLPVESSVALRSQVGNDSLAFALDAYEARDAARAARLLGDVRTSLDLEPIRALYLASALVENGSHALALETFEQIALDTMPQPWRDRGHWILYLAYRGAERSAEADSLLETLAARVGDVGDLARAERDRLN